MVPLYHSGARGGSVRKAHFFPIFGIFGVFDPPGPIFGIFRIFRIFGRISGPVRRIGFPRHNIVVARGLAHFVYSLIRSRWKWISVKVSSRSAPGPTGYQENYDYALEFEISFREVLIH